MEEKQSKMMWRKANTERNVGEDRQKGGNKDRAGGRKKYPYTIKQDAKFCLLHINEDSWCLNSDCTILAWHKMGKVITIFVPRPCNVKNECNLNIRWFPWAQEKSLRNEWVMQEPEPAYILGKPINALMWIYQSEAIKKSPAIKK